MEKAEFLKRGRSPGEITTISGNIIIERATQAKGYQDNFNWVKGMWSRVGVEFNKLVELALNGDLGSNFQNACRALRRRATKGLIGDPKIETTNNYVYLCASDPGSIEIFSEFLDFIALGRNSQSSNERGYIGPAESEHQYLERRQEAEGRRLKFEEGLEGFLLRLKPMMKLWKAQLEEDKNSKLEIIGQKEESFINNLSMVFARRYVDGSTVQAMNPSDFSFLLETNLGPPIHQALKKADDKEAEYQEKRREILEMVQRRKAEREKRRQKYEDTSRAVAAEFTVDYVAVISWWLSKLNITIEEIRNAFSNEELLKEMIAIEKAELSTFKKGRETKPWVPTLARLKKIVQAISAPKNAMGSFLTLPKKEAQSCSVQYMNLLRKCIHKNEENDPNWFTNPNGDISGFHTKAATLYKAIACQDVLSISETGNRVEKITGVLLKTKSAYPDFRTITKTEFCSQMEYCTMDDYRIELLQGDASDKNLIDKSALNNMLDEMANSIINNDNLQSSNLYKICKETREQKFKVENSRVINLLSAILEQINIGNDFKGEVVVQRFGFYPHTPSDIPWPELTLQLSKRKNSKGEEVGYFKKRVNGHDVKFDDFLQFVIDSSTEGDKLPNGTNMRCQKTINQMAIFSISPTRRSDQLVLPQLKKINSLSTGSQNNGAVNKGIDDDELESILKGEFTSEEIDPSLIDSDEDGEDFQKRADEAFGKAGANHIIQAKRMKDKKFSLDCFIHNFDKKVTTMPAEYTSFSTKKDAKDMRCIWIGGIALTDKILPTPTLLETLMSSVISPKNDIKEVEAVFNKIEHVYREKGLWEFVRNSVTEHLGTYMASKGEWPPLS